MVEPSQKPNIILVVLDSARARSFSAYGHKNDTSPFISTLADEAVTFSSAWSPGVWTLPSHVSMFSGYDVLEHEVTSTSDSIKPEQLVFSELSERGYSTGVFSENTWLTEAAVGIKDSFDEVHGKPSVVYPEALNPGEFAHRHEYGEYLSFLSEAASHDAPLKSLVNGAAAKVQYDLPDWLSERLFTGTSGAYYVDQFLNWSDEVDNSRPWAACINLMDAHRPYRPRAEADKWSDPNAWDVQSSLEDPVWPFLRGEEPLSKLETLEGLYDGGILQCDQAIERLFEKLAKRGDLDDTYIIITADHGEGFGEESFVNPGEPVVEHKAGIHPVQTQVPLLVVTPDRESGIVNEPVSVTRVYEAIRSMAEGDFDPSVFESDSGVRIGYTGDSAQRISKDRDNQEPVARSVVESIDGSVVKLTEWGGRTAAVAVTDAQSAVVADCSDIRERVAARFDELRNPKIRQNRAGDIESDVQKRLEELGYK